MTAITLKDVPIAFIDALWEPKTFKDSKPAISSTFLIAKGSANDKIMQKAITEALDAKFGVKAEKVRKTIEGNSQKMCVQDGDDSEYDGFEGHWSVRAKSKVKVTVIDRNRQPVTESSGTIYAGCHVNVILEFYGYDDPHNGLTASLKGVQFVRDGEAFGGGRPAKVEDFDDLGDQGDADDTDDFAS